MNRLRKTPVQRLNVIPENDENIHPANVQNIPMPNQNRVNNAKKTRRVAKVAKALGVGLGALALGFAGSNPVVKNRASHEVIQCGKNGQCMIASPVTSFHGRQLGEFASVNQEKYVPSTFGPAKGASKGMFNFTKKNGKPNTNLIRARNLVSALKTEVAEQQEVVRKAKQYQSASWWQRDPRAYTIKTKDLETAERRLAKAKQELLEAEAFEEARSDLPIYPRLAATPANTP